MVAKYKTLKKCGLVIGWLFLTTLFPAAVQADCWTGPNGCTTTIEGETVATIKCFECVFRLLVSYILTFTGLAFFIMLIVGGFSYLTAGDNPKKVEKAGNTLTFAFMGLIIVISAWIIIIAIENITGINVTEFRIGTPPP